MSKMRTYAILGSLLVGAAQSVLPQNLVFIVVDDLRTELSGAYGVPGMQTPALSRLMADGTTFTRAYTNVPLCSPSRTSFLTGMRPRHNRIWTIGPYFRDQQPNASSIVTLSQALLAAGYNTTAAGKIWHPGTSSGGSASPSVGGDDAAYGSWGLPLNPYTNPAAWECDQFYNGTVQSTASVGWPGGVGCVQSQECLACMAAAGFDAKYDSAVSPVPCSNDCLPDGLVANRALDQLTWQQNNPSGKPFAMFLGFKRPHLNLFAPTWAYDLYDNSSMPLASNRFPSQGMPVDAFYQNGEIAGAHDVHPALYQWTDDYGQNFTLVQDYEQHSLRWAYRASVSYLDYEVGRVLGALKASGLSNNTWVVFFSDHGWSLGEHGEWCKTNNFEVATRVPLVIVPPSGPSGSGYARNATFAGLVELVDVYPTILDVLGLAGHDASLVPPGQLDGDSLRPALSATTSQASERDPSFSAAYSEITRGVNPGPTTPPPDGSIQGLTLRTKDWRFTAWVPYNFSCCSSGSSSGSVCPSTPLCPGPLWSAWNSSWDVELYDHRGDNGGGFEDYNALENVNAARDPAYASVVQQLTAMVQSAWPGVI